MNDLQIQFLSLLIKATEQRVIGWQPLLGNCYLSVSPLGIYHLHWLYWYDVSGITIDRQGIILSTIHSDTTFLWGTDGMKVARELLAKIDSDTWDGYFARMNEAFSLTLIDDKTKTDSFPMNTLHLQLLQHLLQATTSGLISWTRTATSHETFHTRSGSEYFSIEYLFPCDQEERPLGGLVIDFTIPSSKIRFACGTDGFFLIEQILAAAFEDYRAKLEKTNAWLTSEINRLSQILSPMIGK